jgi:hypothetical protein
MDADEQLTSASNIGAWSGGSIARKVCAKLAWPTAHRVELLWTCHRAPYNVVVGVLGRPKGWQRGSTMC